MSRDYERPVEKLARWAAMRPEDVYLRQPGDGGVRELTWAQVWDQTLRIAAGLRALGLQPGDRVAIIAKNCAEWFIADFALQAAGLISVPVFPTASAPTIRYVMEHSEARAAFLGRADDLEALQAGVPPGVITVAMGRDTLPCMHTWDDLLHAGGALTSAAKPPLDAVFSIPYTSGSTGTPKGVELTYRNIAFGGGAAAAHIDLSPEDRLFSYLPLAHMFERTLVQHASVYAGVTVSFAEKADTLLRDLKDAAPTFFAAVPRIWIQFHSTILQKVGRRRLAVLLRIPGLREVIRRQIRTQLGLAQARVCGSGGAPIAPSVLRGLERLGLRVAEGWALTETTGVACVMHPFRSDKIGSIGQPIPGCELSLSDEGELLVRGDAVCRGYHKDAQRTQALFRDGWLRTGDRGRVDADGFYYLTGRLKEIFKTGSGKYVAPVPIEGLLYENDFLDQVCVLGAGLPRPIAVGVLSAAASAGVPEDRLRQSLMKTLARTNQRLDRHERLAGICVVSDPWNVANGFLTPTMKIRRDRVEAAYASLPLPQRDRPIVFVGR